MHNKAEKLAAFSRLIDILDELRKIQLTKVSEAEKEFKVRNL